jgi:hypothetical protein
MGAVVFYVLVLALALHATDRYRKERGGIVALVLASAGLIMTFLFAHHVLAAAYRDKVVVDTYTDWEYERPQGFLTPTNTPKIWFCEPVYQHESLYHVVLWGMPGAFLAVAYLLVLLPKGRLLFDKLVVSTALLYLPYLSLSYDYLTNDERASRFYVSMVKPRGQCRPPAYAR